MNPFLTNAQFKILSSQINHSGVIFSKPVLTHFQISFSEISEINLNKINLDKNDYAL